LSVKIRLKRMGSKKRPFYRFVATDSRNPRDGRFIETLGYYNPMTDPPDIKIDEDAIMKWMDKGAQPSPKTESLFRKLGLMRKRQLLKSGVKKEDLEAQATGASPAGGAGESSLDGAGKSSEAAPAEAESDATDSGADPAGDAGN